MAKVTRLLRKRSLQVQLLHSCSIASLWTRATLTHKPHGGASGVSRAIQRPIIGYRIASPRSARCGEVRRAGFGTMRDIFGCWISIALKV